MIICRRAHCGYGYRASPPYTEAADDVLFHLSTAESRFRRVVDCQLPPRAPLPLEALAFPDFTLRFPLYPCHNENQAQQIRNLRQFKFPTSQIYGRKSAPEEPADNGDERRATSSPDRRIFAEYDGRGLVSGL